MQQIHAKRSNSVAECLASTENKLIEAMKRFNRRGKEEGDSCGGSEGDDAAEEISKAGGNDTGSTTPEEAVGPGSEEDEDDPAAAYFAFQAKRERDEALRNEKAFDDWAKIIVRRQQKKKDSVAVVATTSVTKTAEKSPLSLAEDLLRVYQEIVRSQQ
mmetsp:Transcript_20158/g.45884  ORF Transcript_20158/g.45884 Transcript_20158/m.45884 type:complete len:158 (-) Transcript_20158:1688-2161(-)